MNLSQNVKKITQFRRSEHIFGSCCHQASSCIHSYPKTIKVWWKKSNFLGGQKELALMTLSRNSKKLTKTRQIELMFVNFILQASTCIHSYPKIVNFCRKMQNFGGDQEELTWMTRSQNVRKISKNRQTEHIIGNISLKASTCIHSYLKKSFFAKNCNFLRVTKEITWMTWSQHVGKKPNFVKVNTILAVFAIKHLVASIPTQKNLKFAEKNQIL